VTDPPSICQTTNAVVNQVNWLETTKTIAAVAAFPAALLTFMLGYRQKEKERTLSYYHKVVTENVTQPIFDFFEKNIQALTAAGQEAQKAMLTTRKTIPRSATSTLAAFSTELFNLQDLITERTIVFDEKITEKIRLAFESIQDKASAWFNDVALHKRRNIEELTQDLRSGQRAVVSLLYQGQFRKKGWIRTRLNF
jgi:hypothetical protein